MPTEPELTASSVVASHAPVPEDAGAHAIDTAPTVRRKRRWVGVAGIAVLSLGASAALWREMFDSGDRTGFGDWQHFFMLWEASRVAVERYGELPLYNPYDCGGITLWGNPQLQTYSPWFLLVLAIGTTWATKIGVFLHTAIAVAGAYLFARNEVDLGRVASVFASVVWACGGFFAWHGAGGHAAFLPFCYAPWLLLAWRAAARDLRWSAAVAGIFALTLSEGGVYPPAFFALLLGFDAFVRLLDPASRRGVLLAGVVSAAVAIPLSAFRLLAVRELLADTGGRHVPDHDIVRPELLFRMFLDPERGPWRVEGNEYVWAEYASYIGPIAFALASIGLVVVLARPGQRWIGLGALVFGATMIGHVTDYAPFAILRSIPVYDSLRVPSRYVVLATLYLALAGGVAIESLVAWLDRSRLHRWIDWTRPALPIVIVAGALAHLLWINGKNADLWNGPPLTTEEPTGPFQLQHPGEYGARYAQYPQRNRGTPGCYTAFTFEPASLLRWGPQPQWIVQTGDADVRETGWTTNTWSLDVRARSTSRVTLNRNFDRHWRVDAPAEIKIGRAHV